MTKSLTNLPINAVDADIPQTASAGPDWSIGWSKMKKIVKRETIVPGKGG